MIKTPPPRTILEVWESLPEGTLAQIINNHLVMSPAPKSQHQQVLKKIFLQLNNYVEANNLGEVLFAPVDVYLDEENIYQPDILFIANDHLHIIEDSIKGAPDLIIEILSPGSERLDKVEKKNAYELHGVKEYWVINPSSKKVTGYQLMGNNYTEITSQNGVIVSAMLGVAIRF